MFTALLSLCVAAGSFPLPTIDGKPLAVVPEQKTFRLPMRFDKVRDFYEGELPRQTEGITRMTASSGKRTLTITSKRVGDTWKKATITEHDTETVIELTPVLRMAEEQIEGSGKPLVQFVIGRSGDVNRAVDAIGDKHVEQIRR